VRQGLKVYSKDFERKKIDRETIRKINSMERKESIKRYMEKQKIHFWFPDEITYPEKN